MCLGLVRGALLVVQGLPSLAEDLADLAWGGVSMSQLSVRSGKVHTERDSGVLLTDVVALLLGEEHVRGETTLRRVWVCSRVSMDASIASRKGLQLTLLLLLASGLGGALGLGLLRHDGGCGVGSVENVVN